MTSKLPTVSVCIPTYNRAAMLEEAIRSVLAQTFSAFELIISDNASNDNTEDVVKSFDDPRIRYSRTNCNIGPRNNWNRCLELSRGTFITILPDDDSMLPDNLEIKVGVLSRHPNVGLAHSKFHVIDEEGKVVVQNTGKGRTAGRTVEAIDPGHQVLAAMLEINIICESSVLFRRECYEKLGGFTDRLDHAFDWEYWMRIAQHYDVAFVAKPLVENRLHQGAISIRAEVAEVDTKIAILRRDLDATYWMIETYLPSVRYGRPQLKSYVWRKLGGRVARCAQEMMDEGRSNRQARSFLLEMCRKYPGILMQLDIAKTLVKTILNRRTVLLLKRISPI